MSAAKLRILVRSSAPISMSSWQPPYPDSSRRIGPLQSRKGWLREGINLEAISRLQFVNPRLISAHGIVVYLNSSEDLQVCVWHQRRFHPKNVAPLRPRVFIKGVVKKPHVGGIENRFGLRHPALHFWLAAIQECLGEAGRVTTLQIISRVKEQRCCQETSGHDSPPRGCSPRIGHKLLEFQREPHQRCRHTPIAPKPIGFEPQ